MLSACVPSSKKMVFVVVSSTSSLDMGQLSTLQFHPHEDVFTSITLVEGKIMEAATKSYLTSDPLLELRGPEKSPNDIDDGDLDQAVNWTAHSIL